MRKEVPAYISRMEKATDEEGFHCSGFSANEMAREYRAMRKEITELRAFVSRIGAVVSCADLHHEKGEYHDFDEPCPVIAKFQHLLG